MAPRSVRLAVGAASGAARHLSHTAHCPREEPMTSPRHLSSPVRCANRFWKEILAEGRMRAEAGALVAQPDKRKNSGNPGGHYVFSPAFDRRHSPSPWRSSTSPRRAHRLTTAPEPSQLPPHHRSSPIEAAVPVRGVRDVVTDLRFDMSWLSVQDLTLSNCSFWACVAPSSL